MFKSHIKLWVLKELVTKEASGYELMKRISTLTHKSPSPGYIYPLIISLKEKGLLTSKKEKRKIIYTITQKGKKFLATLEKNKEASMKMIMKDYASLADKTEIQQFSMFFKIMQKDKDLIMKDCDLWNEFRDILFKLYTNDYENKRQSIRKILKKTIKELEKL